MICFVSQSRKSSIRIRKTLLKNDILSYQSGFPCLENPRGISEHIRSLPPYFYVALIDATEDAVFGERACKVIKEILPHILTVVLYDKSLFDTEKFKYFAMADHETDMSGNDEPSFSLSALLTSLGYMPKYEYKHLKLVKEDQSAIYLGMKMTLTEAEYRILLYMCTKAEQISTPEDILSFCFAESYRMVSSNIKHHISHINKKAKAIGGRKLILSERGKGYKINDLM